jgi:hypothetical protein
MDDALSSAGLYRPLHHCAYSATAFRLRLRQWTKSGLYPLKNTAAVAGTALDDAVFGTLLLPADNSPRSVDLWPIFHTGVPNMRPYQLATGKNGIPLADREAFHPQLPAERW